MLSEVINTYTVFTSFLSGLMQGFMILGEAIIKNPFFLLLLIVVFLKPKNRI